MVYINTRTLYFYTQCVTWALFIMQTSLAIYILCFFAPSQACIFLLCRNTKGFSMILSCHMFSKGRGFKISAAFLWKRIFAPCFETQATDHYPILINEHGCSTFQFCWKTRDRFSLTFWPSFSESFCRSDSVAVCVDGPGSPLSTLSSVCSFGRPNEMKD